jgi:hypothetical protein
MAELKRDTWVKDKNWLPLDLMWVLSQSVPERDLIPEPALKIWKWGSPVIYYFNIAFIVNDGTDQPHLAVIYSPSAQRTSSLLASMPCKLLSTRPTVSGQAAGMSLFFVGLKAHSVATN